MDKLQLQKNRLDLEYHGESQKANAFLILLTTGILGFLGTFLWLTERQLFLAGMMVTFIVIMVGILRYTKSSRRMKEILEEIGNIE